MRGTLCGSPRRSGLVKQQTESRRDMESILLHGRRAGQRLESYYSQIVTLNASVSIMV
jgi:hypothetical protein